MRVEENPVLRIELIRFSGNREIPVADLLGVMELRGARGDTPGSVFDHDVLQADLMRITAVYYDRGMVNARVGPPSQEKAGATGTLVLTIPVEEGAVFHLGEITFTGDLVAKADEYTALLQSHPGQVFVRTQLQSDIQRINAYHKERGHGDLLVIPLTSIDPDRHIIDLTLRIEQGPD
jgi:outer membrane protein insertion porin family